MNITLGTGKAVHTALSENHKNTTSCGGSRAAQGYQQTDAPVTCKKCLKILADREEEAARTAYYAGLRDQQDETLSQAIAPIDMDASHAEALVIDATVTEALGERGEAAPAVAQVDATSDTETVQVNRTIYTDQGRIPPYALVMDETRLAWIPSIHRGSVITAMDDDPDNGISIWVYVERDGSLPKVLYFGANWAQAREARDGYVVRDKLSVEAKSLNGHTWRAPRPSDVSMTVYRTEPKPASETDPRTGLPIVTIDGVRYVVGLWQRQSFGNVDYVDFWLADQAVGFSNIWRAYADASSGVKRRIWDAQRALR